MTERANRRPLWIVVVLLAVAAAALWGAAQLPWSAGTKGAPALMPLALLSLAGIAGVLATGGWARPVVGVLLALAGVVAGWLSTDGASGQGAGLVARGLGLVAGVALVAAGAMLVRRGRRMPKLGTSYRTPAAVKVNESSEKELWCALSEGEDPTVK